MNDNTQLHVPYEEVLHVIAKDAMYGGMNPEISCQTIPIISIPLTSCRTWMPTNPFPANPSANDIGDHE